ncbi:putative multi-domain containing protein [Aduncisulcus paluster]|uniref:Signal peptidase complex catalytic subunit SEC11 n=1 Tax=Aduncisulcus paluster TaxID=2918883 RepID=A0ABQ5KXN4_9EUKA|nr:putative multi-domain containing protein [Aduncisulcus paluster]
MRVSKIFLQIIQLALIAASALMVWNTLKVITRTDSPIVVVLSGSMEPGFYRGDLLFLYENDDDIEVGDVVVYNATEREIAIVHRVLDIIPANDSTFSLSYQSKLEWNNDFTENFYLTKGDNNRYFDQPLYGDKDLLSRDDIKGRIRGYFPYVGYITILLNEKPWVKYILFAIMGLAALAGNED